MQHTWTRFKKYTIFRTEGMPFMGKILQTTLEYFYHAADYQ